MSNLLFISFDFHELNKPIKSVAIATLEAYLIKKIKNIEVESFSFNMNDEYSILFEQMALLSRVLIKKHDYICISMYAWNMRYVNLLIELIKISNPTSTIIAGGYEVNFNTVEKLKNQYKGFNHYIVGYAEESLYRIISRKDSNVVLSYEVDNKGVPEIYCNGIIPITSESVVRLETKRGCPNRCTYCAYKNNDHKKITTHNIDKVKKELEYLNYINVEKVNILDAIFTLENYKEILDFLVDIKFKPLISFQMKFELFYLEMNKNNGLLSSLNKLNVELEFGLQSISKEVLSIVERTNDLVKIEAVMKQMSENNIKYEVSVIRGLPGETVESYKNMIEFLTSNHCNKYVVYPLTLLTNTKLFDEREKLELKCIYQNGLEYVIGTKTYNYNDYLTMINL